MNLTIGLMIMIMKVERVNTMKQLYELSRIFPDKFIHKNPTGFGDYIQHSVIRQRILSVLGGYSQEVKHIIREKLTDKQGVEREVITGVILAHVALATPFVVITVTATLVGFDMNMVKASQSLGARPVRTFFKVIMPLILPGVISGALFAFITSFDEVVIVMFMASLDQLTIPKQMWAGIRQEISPVILCMATCLVVLSIFLLTTVELLRRRSEKLRGIKSR